MPIVSYSPYGKPSRSIDVCLIIRQDGIRGEGFSYCFNRSWRNNQVTPSHSTDFSTDFLEQTGGIANGDKGTGVEDRDVGPVNACIGGLPASLAASATDCYLHVTVYRQRLFLHPSGQRWSMDRQYCEY